MKQWSDNTEKFLFFIPMDFQISLHQVSDYQGFTNNEKFLNIFLSQLLEASWPKE